MKSPFTFILFVATVTLIFTDKLDWQATIMMALFLAAVLVINYFREDLNKESSELAALRTQVLEQKSEINKLNLKLGFKRE
jgi:membrane protein implicated in regulation of membrane protease activity